MRVKRGVVARRRMNQNELLEINAPKKFWLNNVLISTEDLLEMNRFKQKDAKKDAKLDFNINRLER